MLQYRGVEMKRYLVCAIYAYLLSSMVASCAYFSTDNVNHKIISPCVSQDTLSTLNGQKVKVTGFVEPGISAIQHADCRGRFLGFIQNFDSQDGRELFDDTVRLAIRIPDAAAQATFYGIIEKYETSNNYGIKVTVFDEVTLLEGALSSY